MNIQQLNNMWYIAATCFPILQANGRKLFTEEMTQTSKSISS